MYIPINLFFYQFYLCMYVIQSVPTVLMFPRQLMHCSKNVKKLKSNSNFYLLYLMNLTSNSCGVVCGAFHSM